MGEKAENHTAWDRGYAQTREDAHLTRGSEVVYAATDREQVGTEPPSGEQDAMTDARVRDRIRVKPGPSFHEPTGYSPLLKRISELYIARELFRAKVEKRKEQNREAAARLRKKDPEAYRARNQKEQQRSRERKKQQP